MVVISHISYFPQQKTVHGGTMPVCKCLSNFNLIRVLLLQMSCNLCKRLLTVKAVIFLIIYSLVKREREREREETRDMTEMGSCQDEGVVNTDSGVRAPCLHTGGRGLAGVIVRENIH